MSGFDFRETTPSPPRRRRTGPSPLGGAVTVAVVVVGLVLFVSAVLIFTGYWLLRSLERVPAGPPAAPPAIEAGRRPVDESLTGIWFLEEDRTGSVRFTGSGEARLMTLTSENGKRAVIMRFEDKGGGILSTVTVDDPASAARGGIRHEMRYAFEKGKLYLWHQGERYAYVRR